MWPVLLSFGPLRLYGYGAAITVGAAVITRVLWRWRAKAGLRDEESFWALVNIAALSGFLGGKILFLFQYGFHDGLSLLSGYSAFGGFVSVPLAVAAFARWKKLSFLELTDYIFVLSPLWHAFGRLGCFLAGCCYGRPTSLPWGVAFRDTRAMVPPELLGVRLHPVQLYEAAGDLVIVAILYRVLRAIEAGRLRNGLVMVVYFAAYGVLRFSLEFLRGDGLAFAGRLSQGQVLGLALIALSGVILLWRSRCSRSC